MRIIAGALGGRILKTPQTSNCRPAMERTRAALFSILDSRQLLQGAVLDLFAGTGSLAFEALSRGADHAVLVENAPDVYPCLVANVQNLELQDRTTLVNADVVRYLRHGSAQPFNLVFIDPPYKQKVIVATINLLLQNQWLAPQAIIAAEMAKMLTFTPPEDLELLTERLFGQTRVCIWQVMR